MKFRKDINGLRAIAVIAVVLFHFNPSWVPGGFAGVDVFFVISGFLMTGIIFKEIGAPNEAGGGHSFSLLRFYVARANRIIPALAILCLALLVFGWFYLTPLDFKALGKHVAGSIGFVSNIFYWRESGYFDAASHEKWLLHTWSLSVEWQFYLIYPLVLLTLRKLLPLKFVQLSVLIGAVLGFVFCVYATYHWADAAYYLLPTRAWQMLLGGVAYLYPLSLGAKNKKYFEWLGLALILSTYFLVSSDNLWPGYLAMLPVLGAFLVIQAQRNHSFITGNVVFQKIGAWSYSIYLWHWPLVVAIYYYSLDRSFVYIGIVLSVVLGFLSYKYIEQVRFSSINNWMEIYRLKVTYIFIFIFGCGATLYLLNGISSEFRRGAATEQASFLNFHALQHKNLDDAYWIKCNTYSSLNDKGVYDTAPECVENKGRGGVFLWGDSHAEALSLGIRTLLKANDIDFYQKTSAGCSAALEETKEQKGVFKKACDHSNYLALNSIGEIKPDLVIIAQANRHDEKDWMAIQKKLHNLGVKNILLVGPVSQWKPSLPKVMIKPSNWLSSSEFLSDPGLDLEIIETDKRMLIFDFPDGFYYISLINSLCKKDLDNYYCRVKTMSGDLLQVDYGHLSESGSRFVVDEIISKKILELIKSD